MLLLKIIWLNFFVVWFNFYLNLNSFFFLLQGNWMKQIKIIGQSINWMTSSFTRFLPKTLQAKTPIRAAKVGIWNVTSVIQPFPDIGSFQCHSSSDGGSRWNLLIARFFPVFTTISWSITMISWGPLSYQTKGQVISKSIFVIFNSPKKQPKKFDFTTMAPQVELFSFVFWRRFKTPKRHSEINWPLVGLIKRTGCQYFLWYLSICRGPIWLSN